MAANNSIGEILVSEEQLATRIREMGADVTRDYRDKDLLLLGILKGAVLFLSDLIRHIEIPNEFVIGYGLDYQQRYRGLPYVAELVSP